MTNMFKNPSLREQPRHKPAPVLPLRQEPSILDWLESTGRLLPRDPQDDRYLEDVEDIPELVGVEDSAYDDLEDDDSEFLDDDA